MTEKEAKEKLERVKAIRAANRGVITKKISDVDTILSGATLIDDQRKSLEVLDRLLSGKLKTIEELDESVLSYAVLMSFKRKLKTPKKCWSELWTPKNEYKMHYERNPTGMRTINCRSTLHLELQVIWRRLNCQS